MGVPDAQTFQNCSDDFLHRDEMRVTDAHDQYGPDESFALGAIHAKGIRTARQRHKLEPVCVIYHPYLYVHIFPGIFCNVIIACEGK